MGEEEAVLIDTSSWIEALRQIGNAEVRERQITPEVCQTSKALAQKCKRAGHTVSSVDLVIQACALFHEVSVEH